LHGGWHTATLLARVNAEASGLDLGMISLLPLQHPAEAALEAIRHFGQDVVPHIAAPAPSH
jgi:hypothetical protein